jgi:sigma-B regulation protein RsbU (phosphoserine phosphatase)
MMRDGDMLFLWTDGLSDALNAAGEGYGEQRLEQLVSRLSPENARDCVLAATGAVTAFAADTSQFDDLTAVAFIYHPIEMKTLTNIDYRREERPTQNTALKPKRAPDRPS